MGDSVGVPTPAALADADAEAEILALLALRAPTATICPSEVARKLVARVAPHGGSGDWRAAMPFVHDAVDRLVASGDVRLSWKNVPLASRAGPYRIRRRPDTQDF